MPLNNYRLRARDFYAVIVDEGKPESTTTAQKLRASNCFSGI